MKNVFMAGVFITLLFCGSPSLSWATSSQTVETVQQKQKIAGVVVDQNGEPIIGANILQKGTSNGTITDINGQFQLSVETGTKMLVVSYVGMKTQEIRVPRKEKELKIVLISETMDIDDSLVDAHNLLDRLEGEFGHNNHMRDMDELMTATMVEAARIVEQAHPDTLDINFGCPVKRVAGKGAGAGMLQNIPLMLEITRAVVDAVKIPVTVKTRLGWDANSKIIVDLAEQLQDCGIAALTIHGRTRAQMYTGEADWTLIGEVKKNPRMHIPIIGNGDITTPQRAKECFDLYGVDAIMIGRASFGRPWFFKEVKHYLETGEELPPLSSEWRLNVLRQEMEDSVNLLDERRGILHVRRHLAASPLFKGIPNFRDTRIAMLRAETKEELYRIFEEIEPLLP